MTAEPYLADRSGRRNSTRAFAMASAEIEAAGGGTLRIPEGNYRVAIQQRSRGNGAEWSYAPEPIIRLRNCKGPVRIEGRRARLFCDDGMRYGSFDPGSGRSHHPTLPFNDRSYRASPYVAMIELVGNRGSLTIIGLHLDGRSHSYNVGGPWNQDGIQINSSGIQAYNNADLTIDEVICQGHGLDGLMIGYDGLRPNDTPKPHRLLRCRFTENGRQGLSWVGGNYLEARDCEFTNTGKGPVSSSPGAGCDIEAENSICRNGLFERCVFADNSGVGLVAHAPSDNRDIECRSCTFVGSTSWSVWPASPGMVFRDCNFLGAFTNPHGSSAPQDATRFYGCEFSGDKSRSRSGRVFIQNYMVAEIDGGRNVLFDNCQFDSGPNTATGLCYVNGPVIARNCDFRQAGPGLAVLRLIFEQKNTIRTLGEVDFSGATFRDPVSLNGRLVGS